MQHPLPYEDFHWLPNPERAVSSDGSTLQLDLAKDEGCFLEVDLIYPPELHLKHNSLTLAPENRIITHDMLSQYSKKCGAALKGSFTSHRAQKLTATFLPRTNYLVYYKNLEFYLQQGLKVTKVHRVIKFVEKPFIRPFINTCTEQRAAAKTATEREMWKLSANGN